MMNLVYMCEESDYNRGQELISIEDYSVVIFAAHTAETI